jgi:hypothetical protein
MIALTGVGLLAVFLFVVLVFFVLVALFQWLWNITVPDVFPGVNAITFWQAFRLILIASMLFGGPAAAGGA